MSRATTSLDEALYCEYYIMLTDITDKFDISTEAASAFLESNEGGILDAMADAADSKVYVLLRQQGVKLK